MRRYLKFIALCFLAAFILWWFGRGFDWAGVGAALGRADWRLISVAALVICATYLIRAYRWRTLLAPLVPANLRDLFAATTVGFGAIFLAGRAGEVVRPVFLPLRDRRVRPAAAFITIGVERIYDMVAVVVLFAANLLWLRAPNDLVAYARVRVMGLVFLLLSAVGIAALVWYRRRAAVLIGWVEAKLNRAPPIFKRLGSSITMLLEQLARALRVLVDWRELIETTGWTILLWGAVTLAYWLVLRAFGLGFGISEAIFVMGWGLVGSLVPTPGGAAGAFHLAAAYGLIFLGAGRDQAAAFAIIVHPVVFGPALFVGGYYFLRSDIKLSRLWRASSEAAAHAAETEGLRPGPEENLGSRLWSS